MQMSGGKSILHRGKSKRKGQEARGHPACLRDSKKAREAGGS